MEHAEPALADLFATDLAPTADITDAEEMLLLDTCTMRSTVVSESMPDQAIASIASDVLPPRAPTLFERVTAAARLSAGARAGDRNASVPAMVEYPGVYNRRAAGGRR
jgi:hypothetical protein